MKGILAPEVQDIVRGTIEGPDPGAIWVCTDGMPEWVKKYASSDDPYAVTVIYSIWFEPEHYTWRNLFHEIKHCEQFYRYKQDFIDVYTQQVIRSGYNYSDFEKEAEKYADKMMERIE